MDDYEKNKLIDCFEGIDRSLKDLVKIEQRIADALEALPKASDNSADNPQAKPASLDYELPTDSDVLKSRELPESLLD